jgi:beta-galactosidase
MTKLTIGATLVALAGLGAAPAGPRQTIPFDPGWRFDQADVPGAERPTFDDAGWRAVNVPHDWSIAGPFDSRNPTGHAGGYLPAGVGWYRKHFTLSAADVGKRVFVDFDGVMANSDVWINGAPLGHRPYGYVSFRYELTGHLGFGDGHPNVLAVRCDDKNQPASRWYSGAGIYRHVRLVVTNPVHLDHWGTVVTTPAVTAESATVHVRTTVVNPLNAARPETLRVSILGPDGHEVASGATSSQSVAAGKAADFALDLSVPSPQLWDLDHPTMYRAVVAITGGGAPTIDGPGTVDNDEVPFGIRTFQFKPDTGFWLNGKNFKINGVCLHADGGAFGAAVPLGVWERRLALLKPLGVNAIRTAHNPPAPEFLDLCDRMGFLVMDEMFDCWTVGKNRYDYHLDFNDWSKVDTRDTVRRDRNHPSIVLYSAGNEIHDTPNANLAKSILGGLVGVFHAEDPTRPVTQALFRPNASHDYTDGLADLLDVVGQNYRPREILAAHRQKPTRAIVGTENTHDRDQWVPVRDHPEYAGEFLWTGVDYLGEAADWPMVGSNTGLIDRTGRPRPIAFQRQSWWSDRPMVYATRRVGRSGPSPTDPGYEAPGGDSRRKAQVLFADWSPRDRSAHAERVEVYSNAERVELTLNGRSLGAEPLPADASPRVWTVPFAPGTLRAVATNGGHVVATHELRTAGPAAQLRLAVDRPRLTAAWDDVATVTAEVTDAAGVPVPDAADRVTFAIDGPGVVAAVDNGDNNSHERFDASTRHAYQGQCVAFVSATGAPGRIRLSASAPGLTSASATIDAAPAAAAETASP